MLKWSNVVPSVGTVYHSQANISWLLSAGTKVQCQLMKLIGTQTPEVLTNVFTNWCWWLKRCRIATGWQVVVAQDLSCFIDALSWDEVKEELCVTEQVKVIFQIPSCPSSWQVHIRYTFCIEVITWSASISAAGIKWNAITMSRGEIITVFNLPSRCKDNRYYLERRYHKK